LVRRGRRALIRVWLGAAIRRLLRVLRRRVGLGSVVRVVVVGRHGSGRMPVRWRMAMFRSPLGLRWWIAPGRRVGASIWRSIVMGRVGLTTVLIVTLR
jgi:hypothetical protein